VPSVPSECLAVPKRVRSGSKFEKEIFQAFSKGLDLHGLPYSEPKNVHVHFEKLTTLKHLFLQNFDRY
jgi:hypothetical protein